MFFKSHFKCVIRVISIEPIIPEARGLWGLPVPAASPRPRADADITGEILAVVCEMQALQVLLRLS